jgi:catechol 2,3-dioxygenase-like lactoylglutathione lyase family enzyme
VIDHFNLPVVDLSRSRRFYEQVLVPLGLRFLVQDGSAVGFGNESWAFGIVETSGPLPRLHLAFKARSRGMVDAFYHAALIAGAVQNGAPNLRPEYDPNYYAAFVLDPDGHNIEAVCRKESVA